MKLFIKLLFGVFLFPSLVRAKDFVQTGTSVSHFYDARSVFINPAALAYEKELNGTHVRSSLSWASQHNQSELAVGLSWGGLGFGVDYSNLKSEPRTRYSLVSALSLSPKIFLGNRLGFNSATSSSEGFTQWDVGLQIRTSPYLVFGALANRVGPNSSYSFGVGLKPMNKITFWTDVETSQRNFGKDWNYQSTLSLELFRGLFLQGGYDKTEQIHLGFQWDLGKASVFAMGQSDGDERNYISHAHFNPTEKPNILQSERTLQITLDSNLKEAVEPPTLFSRGKPSFSEVLYQIHQSKEEPETKSIFVEIKTFPLGLGCALELFQALWEARKAGKLVHVSLENARLKEYLIASAGHHISLVPSSSIDWSSPKSERYYLKGTLDKLGVEAEIVAQGGYKSAPETFVRKTASKKSRENIEQNLLEVEKELKTALQLSGRVTETNWKKAIQLGLLSGKDALELKLVDKVQSIEIAKNPFMRMSETNLFSENRSDLALPPQIALVVASGDITREKIRLLGFFGGEQITPDTISHQLDEAKKDPRIRAVVLRVSSGGGDVLASHLIADQVEALKKIKPVIVSMGDVAASGGYFISAPATQVVTSPLSLTGSIGVFSGKPNLSGFFKKIDLNKEIITYSPYPNLFNEAQKWSKAELKVIERQVSQYYETFINYVASHRSMTPERVEIAAQGRVWWGRKALLLKLVDDIGGLNRAIELAQKNAGIRDYVLKVISPPTGFIDAISETFFVKQQGGENLLKNETIYGALRPYLLSDKPFLFWWDQGNLL